MWGPMWVFLVSKCRVTLTPNIWNMVLLNVENNDPEPEPTQKKKNTVGFCGMVNVLLWYENIPWPMSQSWFLHQKKYKNVVSSFFPWFFHVWMVILEYFENVSPVPPLFVWHLCQAGRWNWWFLGDQGRWPRNGRIEELGLGCEFWTPKNGPLAQKHEKRTTKSGGKTW